MLGATGFVSPPETRVGPQTATGTLSQKLPWFGKLGLEGQAALQQAAALDAQAEALRLERLTEARRLYHEIGFLDAWREAVVTDRETLVHYEELARARYASGAGIGQAVIKIQAEITKDDTRLLEIDSRRATLVAAVNSLRDRPQGTAVAPVAHGAFLEVAPDPDALRAAALRSRPEIGRADAELARARTMIDLARKGYKPDLTLSASYTRVGPRDDPAGIAAPPPDNGQDVFAVSASINLPIHRGKLGAAVREAAKMKRAADKEKRAVVASVDRALGELVERVRLTWQQLRLFEDVLSVQADQSLRSAEAAYASGQLNSLDLLDAERVLLEVRTATERTRADYAIALARLEGAVAEPLPKNRGASQR
jgi:outer membrane protein TolC